MAKSKGDKKPAGKKDRTKQNANLKPAWKPGQSGNPKGKPPGTEHSTTRLKRFLFATSKMVNPTNGKTENITVLEQMDLALINRARKGDVKAYDSIIDRFEGKAVQKNININKVGVDAQDEEKYEE